MSEPMPTPGEGDIMLALEQRVRERREKGIATYGRSLQAFNGRRALVDALEEAIDLAAYLEQERYERAGLERAKDGAYSERNQLVALLARMAGVLGWRAGVGQHPAEDTAWEADWRTILFIDLPTGQASWHFHDSERHLLAGLPDYPAPWDGHTTDAKYERVRTALTLAPAAARTRVDELERQLREAKRDCADYQMDIAELCRKFDYKKP